MVSQSRLKKFFHAAKDLEITDIDGKCDDCNVILESVDEETVSERLFRLKNRKSAQPIDLPSKIRKLSPGN